jgi:hypothetical protein
LGEGFRVRAKLRAVKRVFDLLSPDECFPDGAAEGHGLKTRFLLRCLEIPDHQAEKPGFWGLGDDDLF